MESKIKEFFTRRLGLTIPVNDAYEEFVVEHLEANRSISKTDFVIRTHYTGFVRKKQVSRKKYFVINDHIPGDESLF